MRMKVSKAIYIKTKSAKVGDVCVCPSCGNTFIKKTYQQTFCKSKPKTICKDKYWNTVIPTKRNNRTRISLASARWLETRKGNYNPDDNEHPFCSEALGQD